MIGKIIAGLMVRQIMLDAARDEERETIEMVKNPGRKGSNELKINVRFNCSKDRILIYLEKIIKSAANATDISYEQMLKHLKVTHELIDDISEEESSHTERKADDEG